MQDIKVNETDPIDIATVKRYTWHHGHRWNLTITYSVPPQVHAIIRRMDELIFEFWRTYAGAPQWQEDFQCRNLELASIRVGQKEEWVRVGHLLSRNGLFPIHSVMYDWYSKNWDLLQYQPELTQIRALWQQIQGVGPLTAARTNRHDGGHTTHAPAGFCKHYERTTGAMDLPDRPSQT